MEASKTLHRTDYGNAERFAALFRGQVHYCHQWKRWLIYDGQRWADDYSGTVNRFCKATARSIYKEAAACEDDTQRQELAKWAAKSEKKTALDAMRGLAESELGMAVQPDQLDADPWALNVQNGTLDLRTGELRPHNPADLITKISPVVFDPHATAPTWDKFLDDILEPEDAAFLQRAAGYSLTGDIGEQCLFFLYGSGANGKSTFINVLRAVLGDLATQADFSAFLVKHGGSIPNDLARLKSARLVAACELADGQRLNEVAIKQLTGGDTITARFLHAEFFEFKPAFKLWLIGNYRPEIVGTDHAIWRRIRLVEFNRTIPDYAQDRALTSKLMAELPGVLNWMLAGLAAWRAHGLQTPQTVLDATREYRGAGDPVQRFINEKCDTSEPGAWITKNSLFQAYLEWCEASHITALTQKRFALRCKGFDGPKRRVGQDIIHTWQGVALKSGNMTQDRATEITH